MFGIVILGLVLLAVRSTPALTWVAVMLGAPTTVLLVIQAAQGGNEDVQPYTSALEAVLYFYAAGALITYMLADHENQAIEPQSFTAAVDPAGDRSWVELLYLSFTTLTSTGLSDVVPVKPFARGGVMIEQFAGLAYVAVLVSRLVALTVRGRPSGA